jgi:hypothetical protein
MAKLRQGILIHSRLCVEWINEAGAAVWYHTPYYNAIPFRLIFSVWLICFHCKWDEVILCYVTGNLNRNDQWGTSVKAHLNLLLVVFCHMLDAV